MSVGVNNQSTDWSIMSRSNSKNGYFRIAGESFQTPAKGSMGRISNTENTHSSRSI